MPDRAGRDLAWSAEPDRSGTGQVCARPGSIVQYWAVQRHAEWNRAAPDRTRQCRKRPGRATNDRSVLVRARQNLTGPGMASIIGRGRREGQCQTVHGQAGQGRASLCTQWPWQIRARPGTWCISHIPRALLSLTNMSNMRSFQSYQVFPSPALS